ncbi:MAG: DUF4266 domain-containing protein [Gammaproteobacteria bacterium]|nr:DUF4266 domain-containing protein [Gammaproteobacteria bacterium]
MSRQTMIRYSLSTLAFVLMLSGCASVEPWERGTLARPQMASDPHPLQSSLSTHVYNSREAASGGNSAGGGGCGCY